MSGQIDALYIFDEQSNPIVEQVYRSRPPSAPAILPLYLAHAAPRPSLLYIPGTTPPVTVFSVVQSNLLFLALSEVDTEPLLVLEFLHRVVDVLEDFVGAPLLSSKLQANYEVVAQLLHEMCDAGIVCNTEPNALQEVVEMPGWMGKLLGGVGLPGSSTPILGQPNALKQSMAAAAAQGPAIPWRKSGVRHTSNELYVDIIESLSVTIAPSGRLISAISSGTIAFTAKISGVPDLLLSLTAPGGQKVLGRKFELPVFHPCVRLARWRERPGELSFVPPDGRFILAGYEVDLLPMDPGLDQPPSHMEKLFLPAFVDVRRSLGPTGSDFEVRLILNTNFPGYSSFNRPGVGRSGSGTSTPSFLGGGSGNSSMPALEEVVVTVPIPKTVRNITDMQASRGEALFSPGSATLEWRVPTKDAGTISGTATLRCTVVGHYADDDLDDDVEEIDADANLLQGYYDASASYQNAEADTTKRKIKKKKKKKVVKKPSSRAAAAAATAEASASASSPADPLALPSEDPELLDASEPHTPTPPVDLSSPQPESSIPQSQSQPQPQSQKQSPARTPPESSIFLSAPRKTKTQLNATLMPNSASVSFSVRGWLPSGIKVESLNIDPRRSRGLGEGVKPYKGVKYICVSRKGVERRC
ncbi:AP-3 adaptor complex subunit MU [Aspergillus sclerotioniger CBS 115572]|uniref:AP-3 adaptor complex subunit MU n=1 Tax=Aspergillus sclerotioniger CBS 115572 TaxID=1450535 RepID=A0A317XEZ3_9EURO|nr:AP-3 adaptor complex subunit MU [Aspergillus sclerotioniger CBS 115572]PWY95230.1 AP-3 adaptor complex subunit MU [Aspergillus sclerotioniger CBS 115572]